MLVLLAFYCVMITFASLLGGWIPNMVKLDHRHTQMVLSLVSGVMLGVAFLHLFPHSIVLLDNERTAMVAGLAGLLFMFYMVRMFHFHYHDSSDSQHDCEHDQHQHEIKRIDVSWIGLAIGFAIHSMIDGIALGAAVGAQADAESGSWIAGFAVFLAILLHKPLDALTITSLMAAKKLVAKSADAGQHPVFIDVPDGCVFFLCRCRNSWRQSRTCFRDCLGIFRRRLSLHLAK